MARHGSRASFASVIVQIMLLDIVFSLDSVITAVGMVDQVWVMIAAVDRLGRDHDGGGRADQRFVDRHPTVKMLALSFLLLIGMSLVARGLRPAHSEGLHLLRDGLLGVRRDDQPPDARQRRRAGAPSRSRM